MFSNITHNTAVDLAHTYGLILVGVFITAGLWGMSCAQTAFYFYRDLSDGRILSTIVVVLWVLDTVHFLFCVEACWEILIPKFGDLDQFLKFPQGIIYQLFATAIVTLITQGFFLWRIWRFSHKSCVFPVILVPLAAGSCTAFLVEGLGQPAAFFSEKTAKTLILIISVTGATVDIMIALILSVMLWKSRTGLQQSDRMIFRLMGAAIGTGSCTAICRIFYLIAIFGWPHYYLEFVSQIPLATVNCNAVLAVLNSRDYFKGGTVFVDTSSKSLELTVIHTLLISSLPESADQDRSHAEIKSRQIGEDVQE